MLPITLKSTQLFTVFKLATGGNVFLVFFKNTNEEKLKKNFLFPIEVADFLELNFKMYLQ